MQSCRHTQSRRARWLKVAVSVAVGAIAPGARAQQGPPASDEQPVSPPVPAQGGGVVFTPPQVTTTHVYVPPPGYPQPGTDINPGLPSSSRPVSGDQRDSFDLLPTTRGTPVLQGDKGATGVVSSRLQKGERATAVPEVHIVNRGDTLWDLSARYYQNPYYWPKVWSYNPQLQNPHWIYPGDQLRMLGPNQGGGGGPVARLANPMGDQGGAGGPGGPGGRGGQGNRLLAPRRAAPNAVFLRDQGYIGDPNEGVWGELIGAREDQMLLGEGNHVYVQLKPGKDVRPGQELQVFHRQRRPPAVKGSRRPPGEIVTIRGTVRVDHYDPKTHVARGRITESLDVIERGAAVGPLGRKLEVVSPRPSEVSAWTYVISSVHPHVYMGQNQLVFLDKGSEDGLKPGNRLIVVRKGDTWRRSLRTAARMARERVVVDSPDKVDTETTPLRGDEDKFPAESVAELRVLRTEKYSSIALVTESSAEIVVGDRALARKGY